MLASRDFKRLGDLAAGTLMIYQESQGERRELSDIAPEHPPGNLTGDEQRALLAFAERSSLLSADRSAELAGILSGITGQEGERLHVYASWLWRGR